MQPDFETEILETEPTQEGLAKAAAYPKGPPTTPAGSDFGWSKHSLRNTGISPGEAFINEGPDSFQPNPTGLKFGRKLSPYPESNGNVSAQTSTTGFGGKQKADSSPKLPFQTARQIALATPEQIDWISKPYVAAGAITEVDGKVKLAGKSTWTTYLCRAVLDGLPFMGEPTSKSPVLYLTEQPPASWRLTLERAGLLGREDFHCLYFRDIRGIAWQIVADDAVNYCREIGARLLIVDTLGQFAGIAGDSENNSGDALQAMMPLQEAAGHGLAVMILRHDRKSGGLVGESGRGSSAYSGAVDIVLSIRRPEGNTKKTLRTIHAVGRFDETPDELVIDLTPTGYVSLGTLSNVAEADAEHVITSAAPRTPEEAVTLEDLIKDSDVSRSMAQRVVKSFRAKGALLTIGKGKRGDPFRYYLPDGCGEIVQDPPSWGNS